MATKRTTSVLETVASRLTYTLSQPEKDSTGIPLIVLHGWGSSRSDWDSVVDAFSADPRTAQSVVLTIDMPGHGDSEIGAADTTIAAFVDNVNAVMEKEQLSGAVAIGHSLGGVMALELAVRHPERVSRVVGVDTYHYLQVYPKQSEEAVEAFSGGFTSDLNASVRGLVELSSTASTPEVIKQHVRESTALAASQPDVITLLVDGLRWDLDGALDVISGRDNVIPVTAIVSEALLSPEAATRFDGLIPFTTYPERGHYLPLEDAQLTATMIADELTAETRQ